MKFGRRFRQLRVLARTGPLNAICSGEISAIRDCMRGGTPGILVLHTEVFFKGQLRIKLEKRPLPMCVRPENPWEESRLARNLHKNLYLFLTVQNQRYLGMVRWAFDGEKTREGGDQAMQSLDGQSASAEKLNTHQKALAINLDPASYGSFAEIGAGQEVARWFLVVGGASGTVAKSISAYDKEISDDLYGSGARYVSKERLNAMLDSEWAQLINQLKESRGSNTRFFSFVDTISARNYAGTNEPHGWVGLRFQLFPGGQPNDVILHINLRDPSNHLQQESIGILGVNLIYAVLYQLQTKESFFENVAQDIEKRVEIDCAELRGPAFEAWDQRAILVRLIHTGLAEAVYFPPGGLAAPPIEVLHKKAVVLAPGSFEHVDPTHAAIHERMLAAAIQKLRGESDEKIPAPLGLFCLSAMPLGTGDPRPDVPELLRRVDALRARGGAVLLFRERELYSMTALLNRYTAEHVRFVVGLSLLVRVFEYRYNQLAGSLLEGLSRLLAQNVRIYAYPMPSIDLRQSIESLSATSWKWTDTNGWVSANQLRLAPPLGHLYDYVLASKFLVPMQIPEVLAADA